MSRSPLPQNYIKEGTLWQDFEGDLSDWVKGGTGTKEVDAINYKTGAQSLKLTCSDGVNIYVDKTISPAIDLSGLGTQMYIWVYVEDYSAVSTFYVHLWDDSTSTYWDFPGTNLRNGWNVIRYDWRTSGLNFSSITKIRIRLVPTAGKTAVVSSDSLYYGIDCTMGRALLAFDDQRSSIYDVAYPIMDAVGIKGTIYTIPIYVGTATYMSLANLSTVYNAGWALANHTYNHSNLTLLSQTEAESDLSLCKVWLDDNGFTKASNHLAYPYGAYNDTVIAAAQDAGMLTGRTTITYQQYLPVANSFKLTAINLENKTVAQAKVYVDLIVKLGCSVIFYIHTLGDGSWTSTQFQEFVNYLVERRIVCVTVDAWYQGLTNPRYRGTLSRSAR